jgi:hypothetical protein
MRKDLRRDLGRCSGPRTQLHRCCGAIRGVPWRELRTWDPGQSAPKPQLNHQVESPADVGVAVLTLCDTPEPGAQNESPGHPVMSAKGIRSGQMLVHGLTPTGPMLVRGPSWHGPTVP